MMFKVFTSPLSYKSLNVLPYRKFEFLLLNRTYQNKQSIKFFPRMLLQTQMFVCCWMEVDVISGHV